MGNKQSDHKITPININLRAEPSSDEERNRKELLDPILAKSPRLLEDLNLYEGCGSLIKSVMSDPNPDLEKKVWEELKKCVNKLYKFYKFSKSLEKTLPTLLGHICIGNPQSNIQSNQTLVCQLSQIFYFSFKFDELKMTKPAIQNDFSYYRRVLSRMKLQDVTSASTEKLKVDEELANTMSFFFAFPAPMIKVIIDTTLKSTDQVNSHELVDGLSLLANLCYLMIDHNPGMSGDDKFQLLCMMSGSIMLVDHLLPQGVFTKKSPIKIKACIQLLKASDNNHSAVLLNCLRFSSAHLSDDQTMSDIKKLLN